MKMPPSVSVKAKTFTPVSHLNTSPSTSSKEMASPAGAANVTSGISSAVMTSLTKKSRADPFASGGTTSLSGPTSDVMSIRVIARSVRLTTPSSGTRRRILYLAATPPLPPPPPSPSPPVPISSSWGM